jgi:hypothetical protein
VEYSLEVAFFHWLLILRADSSSKDLAPIKKCSKILLPHIKIMLGVEFNRPVIDAVACS